MTADYPLIGQVVTHKGVKTIRLRDTGICYRDTQERAFNKQTGKRPGDTPTGLFLRLETVREATNE